MAKRRRQGSAQGSNAGGGFVRATGGLGLNPATTAVQNPSYPTNPYTATPAAPLIDPAYEAYKVSAGRNVALADADAGYNTAQIENSYGLGTDLSNPYSKAALLTENFRRAQRGTTNSLAAQGQLYSGAMQTAQDENARNYSMGYDQLSRGYNDAKYQNTRNQLGTYASNSTGVDQAGFDAVLNALKALGGK